MNEKRRIIFTGGGTAGHVTPNIALIESLDSNKWDITYVGSAKGIEKSLLSNLPVHFYSIASGKLRRYFSWQNFIDPLFIFWGVLQSIYLCLWLRPHVVFSKGGFVAVPIVVAAWLCRIPVICHESDVTPGLANKICFPFARWVCVNFPQTKQFLPQGKVLVTGSPLRQALRDGDPAAGRAFLELNRKKPIVLFLGGSLGAQVINDVVQQALPELLEKYQLVHIVGTGNLIPTPAHVDKSAYIQLEYIHDEFGDVLAAADYVVSRAGANALYELLVAQKLHVLIPLSKRVSRGDQIINAKIFKDAGMSLVLEEENLDKDSLLAAIMALESEQQQILEKLQTFQVQDAASHIVQLLQDTAR